MSAPSPTPLPVGHAAPARGKSSTGGEFNVSLEMRPMAELARQIIRQQWPLRHHPDPLRRAQARTLIRTHILLLRKWTEAPALVR